MNEIFRTCAVGVRYGVVESVGIPGSLEAMGAAFGRSAGWNMECMEGHVLIVDDCVCENRVGV